MSNIELRSSEQPITVSERHGELSTAALIRRAAADLTPFQAYRVSRNIARRRMATVEAIARKEDELAIVNAHTVSQAEAQGAYEEAQAVLHAQRTDCLARGAAEHDAAAREINRMQDSLARTVFGKALVEASAGYASGVARRARG